MVHEERVYWLAFSLVPGIGTKRLLHLLRAFETPEAAWRASDSQLAQAGLEDAPRAQLLKTRASLDLNAELARVKRSGAQLLTLLDDHYPPLLKTLPDAPPLLYVLGEINPLDDRALAVVGTRRATKYGRDAADDLAAQIAAQSVTIVSGLAPGIDAAAHQGALRVNGRTIAVLGSGIDIIYPREHTELARKIMQQGAVISEFPIGMRPDKRNFPRRNRIISGLALGVLVVEAPEDSGALITVTTANEQGREVFAVPANIYNLMGRGTNKLIQDGAKLVMSAEDILNELHIAHAHRQTQAKTEQAAPANDLETALLKLLGTEPIHIDELVRLSGLPIATVTSTLTLLELKGLAETAGFMLYTLPYR